MRAKKARNSERNRKKLDEDAMLCKPLCCQTDVGSSQKHFLPFRVLLNVSIDPSFSEKKFFFSILALFKEKFGFPAKTFLA